METIKACVIGDGAVGKTSMLYSFTSGHCPGEYVPTIFDSMTQMMCVDGKVCTLSLWDTAGQEDYDRLRPLSYPETDVFIVCYSVVGKESFRNVSARWLPEIRAFDKVTPIVLVGNKCDVRGQYHHGISTIEGEQLRTRENLAGFRECSAFTQEGLKEVFEDVIRIARDHMDRPAPNRHHSNMCCLVS